MARSFRSHISFVVLFLTAVFLLLAILVFREQQIKRPTEVILTTTGMVEMCLTCHETEVLDGAHDRLLIGCSPCHLGDAMAIDKEKAHVGMALNPGDLRVVERTCGVSGCHPEDVGKVKNSLMATNRGILATLLYYWDEHEDQNADMTVEKLMRDGQNSFALDYYRKLCAVCHLWKEKNKVPGGLAYINEMGGGCTACHSIPAPEGSRSAVILGKSLERKKQGDGPEPHPLIVKKVPEENCIRCHNRSGRIGLSYAGVFESEGYGTPYEEGEPSSQRLVGNRFYLEIAEDVHHRAQMPCIDCHTRDEIMGDGTNYAHYEEQLEVTCIACHDSNPGKSKKGNALNNVENKKDGSVMIGKIDGKQRKLRPPHPDACLYPGHSRLSCESCHSTWVPQCYGCHIKRDKREDHMDQISMQLTKGWWSEGRSYIRYERPMLAIWGERVVIVTPGCQDIVTLIDEKGKSSGGFNRFTMAAINPHTIQAKGRDCKDCHAQPKTVGLGEGTLTRKNGKWDFFPVDRGVSTPHGQSIGLDNFVSIEGKPLQYGSRKDLRPFNRDELHRILRVGMCLDCHAAAADPVYQDYTAERTCPVFVEP